MATRSSPRLSERSCRTRSVSSSPRTEDSTPSCLILIGPTAVGKTAVIRDVRTILNEKPIELISADSRQVYRGMDIGTAKPDSSELRAMPHHLIDVVSPDETWDIGRFVESADRLVGEIRARHAVPVISGGTAFYIRGFLFGLPGTPKAGLELRRQLEKRRDDEGIEALRAELERVDPESASRIAAGDGYRILRALEVYQVSGRPLSSFRIPDTLRPGIRPLTIGLMRERTELYARVNARVDAMFAQGLPAEVESLVGAGYGLTDPGMQSIGYREFLEEGSPPWSTGQLDRIREQISRNTRRYAKRQMTFFRRLPGVRWVDPTDQSLTSILRDGILSADF